MGFGCSQPFVQQPQEAECNLHPHYSGHPGELAWLWARAGLGQGEPILPLTTSLPVVSVHCPLEAQHRSATFVSIPCAICPRIR